MFISFLYLFRATMCPLSEEITLSMRHLVFVTLKQMDSLKLQIILNYPPFFRLTNTKCRTDRAVSPDDGHIVAPNMYKKEINILRKIVHQVGFTRIYKIYNRIHVQKNIKLLNTNRSYG